LLFAEICQQYLAILRELNQTVLAEVISAVELTEEQQQAVRDKVIAMTNAARVELDSKLDPDLIGGVITKLALMVSVYEVNCADSLCLSAQVGAKNSSSTPHSLPLTTNNQHD